MDNDRQQLLRGHLGRGAVLSFLVHASFLLPILTLAIVLGRKEAAEHDLEVSFEDVSPAELPDNLPPIEPQPPPPPPKPAQRVAEKTPEPETLPEKPPEEQKKEEVPPPQPRPEKAHEKMVDLDMGKDVPPPEDAKFLAQKNNRAKEETRATDTNLEREQKGTEAASTPSERKEAQTGDAERKIARDEDQASKRGRSAPTVVPHTDPRRPESSSPAPNKSLLAMRDAPKRNHDVTPETADPSLPRDPEGLQSFLEDRPDAVKDLGGAPGTERPLRLSITGKQYEYLFGDDAEAARRLAEKERSRRPGRFTERLGRVKSALENFIPEVRPGNQTALNTRAAPFAAFIARMHRNIHELWGFGFLEDLDGKPASNPLNNVNLVTKLELVLNGDGTIGKVTIVQASGLMQFDVAAIDAVYSAGPYPDPPREIRSGNGKIYIHWTFHRDERQCATSGVDYYILDNAPAGGDKGEPEMSRGLPAPEVGPRLKRLDRSTTAASDNPAHRAKRRELDEAAGGPEEPDHEATRQAQRQVMRADDPAAREAAASWFEAYSRGDLTRMVSSAALPFRSSSGVAAKTAGELRSQLKALLEESSARREVRALQIYSPAGARGALGSLPPGFDEGAGALFAVAHISGDTFVLVLGQRSGHWKAIGLVRR
jgi:TonB C terminal